MIKIRSYRKIDYSAVKAILQEANLFNEVWDSEANLSGMIEKDPQSIIVAVNDKSVVGNVFIIRYGSKIAWLFRLAVKKNYRNQGIGSQLIKHVQKIAKKRGANEVGFYVDANNLDLQAFYQKKRFKTSRKPYIYMWKEV